ncbi:MAG: hypothetical protein V3S60_09845 [Acidimicrobiia bacterium]
MADTYVEDAGVGRRELLKKTAIGGGLVVAALAAPGLTGTAEAKGGKWIVLDIDTDGFADFESTGAGLGAFYVSGEIMARGTMAPVIGSFHCWGYLRAADGLGVVNQEFDLNGRGKILIAGVESDAPRAVTGGTGNFRNARGQGNPDVELFDFNNSGKFRIAFNLTGAKGPPIV